MSTNPVDSAQQPEATRTPRRLAPGTVLLVGTIALPGLLKLDDWAGFVGSLKTFHLLPAWARQPVAVVAPALELVPLILWVAGRRAAAACVTLLYLLASSSLVAWHWALGSDPVCRCFGALQVAEHFKHRRLLQGARNLGLTCWAGICVYVESRKP